MKTDWNKIRVVSPCNARWEDMAGDEQARFCGQCRKHVFNLSAMTQPQIESLILEKEDRFCGRFYRRPDGRMLTSDCPTGRWRGRDRLLRWAGSVFATILLMLGFRSLSRAQESRKATVPRVAPNRLLGEVQVSPAVMSDIVVRWPKLTNAIGDLSNCAGTKDGPVILGKIALPPQTDQITQPVRSK